MENIILLKIFGNKVNAFFTGKTPGSDLGRISKIASVKRENIYIPLQQHTDRVLILDSDLEPKIADAVITNRKGLLLGVQVADCVPILLHDTGKDVTGVVHAGWRGTAEGILKKTITAMADKFNSSPSDIIIAIGPSIKWCCYKVGFEVIESVGKATGKGDYIIERGGQYCVDLPSANTYQALSIGVLPENIWISGECTSCHPDKYYSYRYARGTTGRQGGFIGII